MFVFEQNCNHSHHHSASLCLSQSGCVPPPHTHTHTQTHTTLSPLGFLGCWDIFYGYVKLDLALFLSVAAWKMTTDDKLHQGRCLSACSAFITADLCISRCKSFALNTYNPRLSSRAQYGHKTLTSLLSKLLFVVTVAITALYP